MAESRARGPTYKARFRVDVGVFEPLVSCHAVEVARHGVVLMGLTDGHSGQLIWLHIHLPEGRVAEATGTIRKVMEDGGVIVDFSMFLRGTHRLWEEALVGFEQVRTLIPTDSERRKHPRSNDVRFLVRAGDQAWESLNYSVGGLRVSCPVPLERGTSVELELIHPVTRAIFLIRAEVVRSEPETNAMGLRFLDMGDTSRAVLRHFFETGEAPPDDD